MRCETRMRYSGPAAHLVDPAASKLDPPTVGGYVAYREKPDDVYDARDYEPYVYTVFPRLHAWHANTGFEIAGVTLHGERQPGISESIVCNNVANIFNTGGYVITAGDDVYAIPKAEEFRLPMTEADLANIEGTYANWLVVPPEYVRRAMSTAIHGGTATLVGGAKMAEILELWSGRVLPAFNIDHFLASWRARMPQWAPLFDAIRILWPAEFAAFEQAPSKRNWCYRRLTRSLNGFNPANAGLLLPAADDVPNFLGGTAALQVPPRVAFDAGAVLPADAAAVALRVANTQRAVDAVNDVNANPGWGVVERTPRMQTVIEHDDAANFRDSATAMFAGAGINTSALISDLFINSVFKLKSEREYSNLHRSGAPTSQADYCGVFGRYVTVVMAAAVRMGLVNADLSEQQLTNFATAVIAVMLAAALGRPYCELHAATMRAILFHYYVGRAVTGAVPGGMFQVNLMA